MKAWVLHDKNDIRFEEKERPVPGEGDGAFAEYVTVPYRNVIEIPSNVSFEKAAMMEPMAVSVHAMRLGIGKSGAGALKELRKDAAVCVSGLGVDEASPGGRVVMVGNPFGDIGLPKDTYWKILRNQLSVVGTWNSGFVVEYTGANPVSESDWSYALERVASGGVDPEALITHSLPLEKLYDGLLIMKEKREDYCKVMVTEQ